ncbi:MAG TPA: carbonic anhydrase [Candidatus Limnocylindria bacterium]|nr:carbonic anhydrase [Candidatus Limnocylindria bacterium]
MAVNGEFERILEQNERFTEAFDRSALTAAPLTGLAILTCMDARIDVEDALGLRVGDAHIIRNAGALASEDAIRSLVVSQQILGTREIVVIAHTQCGLHGADETAIRARIEDTTGSATNMELGAFADLDAKVREQVEILRDEPTLLDAPVHGLVYEVETGRLRRLG